MEPIYENTVDDGAWRLAVEDDIEDSGGYRAHLRVYARDEKMVHEESVGVMYAARFGPDVADVQNWHALALKVIDNPELRRVP